MKGKDRHTANDRPGDARAKPGQPGTSDETGDTSVMNADHPMLVREHVGNTSDSSGLHVDDEARGKKLKEQLERGLSDVQPTD